ncbi:MAG: hypothetical protein J6R81_01285 [Alistipes sp.]|nr:hypothetical protein [Alistipes sp.]
MAAISHTIAIDFDGTCVEHDYPSVGLDVEGAVDTLRALNKKGHRLILYTMRSGAKLDAALRWFKERGIELWAVNENPEQKSWTESIKVYAHYYIDDSALGCPIKFIDGAQRPVIDWAKMREIMEYNRIL